MSNGRSRDNGKKNDVSEGLNEQNEMLDALGNNNIEHSGFDDMNEEEKEVSPEDNKNLEVVLDIPVTISMEIGRTLITIRNLLQLNQGSVVELDRVAGEPMDVLVNGCLIAHGEVVVVNEKFGIRLTDVISPVERVRKLR
ncbi:flagellar motor switch protein FliN [Gammaproteobacteria bacterium]